jgi:protein TonB
VPLAKTPPPPERMKQPADEPDDPATIDEVKPLLGAPAPVSLDEPPVPPVETSFPMPVENSHPEVTISNHIVPPVIGDPAGDPKGKFRPEGSIFDVPFLDHKPHAKVQIPPEYPYAMKQSGTSGSVLVEFDVDKTGRVTRAEAIRCTDREFVEPALRAVRQWRFEPGRKDGRAVPFRMTIPIEFSLENGT